MENYNKLKKRYEEFYNAGLNKLEAFLKSLEEFDFQNFLPEELRLISKDLESLVISNKKSISDTRLRFYASLIVKLLIILLCGLLLIKGGALYFWGTVIGSNILSGCKSLPILKKKIERFRQNEIKAEDIDKTCKQLVIDRERKKQAITIEPTKNSVGKGKSMNELYDFIVRSFSKLPNDMARGYWTKLQSIFIIYGGDLEKNKEMIVDNLGSLADQVVESLNMIDGLYDKSNREENLGSSVNL